MDAKLRAIPIGDSSVEVCDNQHQGAAVKSCAVWFLIRHLAIRSVHLAKVIPVISMLLIVNFDINIASVSAQSLHTLYEHQGLLLALYLRVFNTVLDNKPSFSHKH